MPGKLNRNTEPSADFFRHPEAGSTNGTEPSATTETEEWDAEAVEVDTAASVVSPTDEFDLDALRLTQDFDAQVGGQSVLTNVPVRKPGRQEFVRVHPDQAWHFPAALLDVREETGLATYVVQAHLLLRDRKLVKEVYAADLVTTINRSGVLFLWPVKRGRGERRDNKWLISAQEGARVAQESWVRVLSDQDKSEYEILRAAAHYPDPEWPLADLCMGDLIKLAFTDHIIATLQHPVLRRLRGEI